MFRQKSEPIAAAEAKVEFDEVTEISDSSSEHKTSPLAPDLPAHENQEKEDWSPEGIEGTLAMSRDETDVEPNAEGNNIENVNESNSLENVTADLPQINDGGNDGQFPPFGDDPDNEEHPEDGDNNEDNSLEDMPPQMPPPHLIPGPASMSLDPDQSPRPFGDGMSLNLDAEGDEVGPDEAMEDDSLSQGGAMAPLEGPHHMPLPQMQSPGGVDDDDDDDEEDTQAPLPEGSYDPADYEDLDVAPELRELFTFISKYTPQNIELEHKLKPYIPDYIPAVGDIDAFIKVPRVDEEPFTIGLTVLDEPSAKQSDATVLDLQLRAAAKHTTLRAVVVKTVADPEKNNKVIEKWMRDISDLHRAKPPPTVHYSKRMPDIDSLMQEWPGEMEDLLRGMTLPSAALQVELPHFVDIICSILDIPVYKSRIQSLHVLFTLFSVFKNSAHFRHLAEENNMENEESSAGGADRLVL